MKKIMFSTLMIISFSICGLIAQEKPADHIMMEFIYKKAGGIDIKADFYPAIAKTSHQPLIIWLHGGALIWGSRKDLPEEQLEFYLNEGYSILAADYRLAPETKLNRIVQDICDAISWARTNAENLQIDRNRIYVIGHSAGAYLALVSGYKMKDPPKAIISFYGYADILGTWYSQPDPHYSTFPTILKKNAFDLIQNVVITSAKYKNRFDLYLYCRQNGIWPELVSGKDPEMNIRYFKRFSPIYNITKNYPPTLLIHGNMDTDVPFDRSVEMNEILNEHGVEHQFVIMNGYGHVFDRFEGGLDNNNINHVFYQILTFLESRQ